MEVVEGVFGATRASLVVDDATLGKSGRGHPALNALDQGYVLHLKDVVSPDRRQVTPTVLNTG